MSVSASGVPSPAPHELRRERLLELLHRHRSRSLIVLVAPAGFGKSTLAATYARDSGAAVAWLTLQPSDRDSRRLFARLSETFEAAFEDEPQALPELRRGLGAGSQGVGLARLLLADLARAPAGFILVLDDFHVVDDADDVVGAIDALVRGLPDGGQVVLTTREPPALSMTRLVASGAVFPLGTEDLRFTPDETRALRQGLGGDPSHDEQAEGWVAGILLGGVPRQLGIGGGSLLAGYVEREVLSRLKPSEQRWLETLSVVDVVTPRAAERLLGPGPWTPRLLPLTSRCPFLVAGADGSFRIHALVRETLLNRVRRAGGARASKAWTAARDLAKEAFDTAAVVRACEELGDIGGAVEVVRHAAAEALRTGRWPTLLASASLLSPNLRHSDPELCLMEARALLNTGRPAEARDAAQAALEHGGRSGDVSVQVSAIIELGTVTHFSGDTAAADDWIAAADHLLRNGDLPVDRRRLLEGRALGLRGIASAIRGDVTAAREAFGSAERLLGLLGPSRDLAVVQQNLGAFCARIGEYADGEAALSAAAMHWRVVGDANGLALSQINLGDLHLRVGDLEPAGRELADAVEAARTVGSVRLEGHASASLGVWHRASGRLLDAVAAYEEGIRLAEEAQERELLCMLLVWRAEVALIQGDSDMARTLLARGQVEAQRLASNTSLALVDRALGRLHLADGAGERAVRHLESALDRTGDAWGSDQKVETLYWLGTTYLALGRAQHASALLEQAVALCEQANLPTLLARPAAEDNRLLRHGRESGISPVLLAEVERIADMRRPWTGVRRTPRVEVVAHHDLPRVEVQLFGPVVVHREGELLRKQTRKVDRARELLALLILHPNGLEDSVIAEQMWPDMPPESALHNLQMAAYSLRNDLGSKAAVRYGAHKYQLNPQLELAADVRVFDAALARARGAMGDILLQNLTRAVEVYRDPLLADAAWPWAEPRRLEYRARYVAAALHLAHLLSPVDSARSDGLAETVLAVAPETDSAYEQLIVNARRRAEDLVLRRLIKRYETAAAKHGFAVNPNVINPPGNAGSSRASRGS